MIYLNLFLTFLKLGTFAFGGAYGAVSLFREEILAQGWLSESMFTNVVAISESTPGPIMINVATYVGSQEGGILGAIVASLGVVLPSSIIILLVSIFFTNFLKRPKLQGILKGIRFCVMGLVLATGFLIGAQAVFNDLFTYSSISIRDIDIKAIGILLIMCSLLVLNKKYFKKEISPILIIVYSAILGVIVY